MKKVAVVTFPDTDRLSSSFGKEYNFVTEVEGLEKGNIVVVDTINGLRICQFVRYDDLGFGNTGVKIPSRWLIQKIDLEAHTKRVEAAAKIEKIKVMMEIERKKAQELEIYEILAKQNPAMAELLEQFKQLQEVL
jgi:hypothetical protein